MIKLGLGTQRVGLMNEQSLSLAESKFYNNENLARVRDKIYIQNKVYINNKNNSRPYGKKLLLLIILAVCKNIDNISSIRVLKLFNPLGSRPQFSIHH